MHYSGLLHFIARRHKNCKPRYTELSLINERINKTENQSHNHGGATLGVGHRQLAREKLFHVRVK